MKERKIKNIKTYYLSDDAITLQDDFEDLAHKERTSVSELSRLGGECPIKQISKFPICSKKFVNRSMSLCLILPT